VGKWLPATWEVDDAYQLLCRHLGSSEVARVELERPINEGKLRLLRWDTTLPGWQHDSPQLASRDAARLTRLGLDDGHGIVLTRDPSGRPAEFILNGETWYYNGNLHYVIPHDDLVAQWPFFAEALDQQGAAGLTAKPEDVSALVWAVSKLLEKLEQERGAGDAGIREDVLLGDVRRIAPKGMTIGSTTLREARRFRRDPGVYCRQRAARKRKTKRPRA
jgi:hypothetical protein